MAASVNNGVATGTGIGIANAPNGGIGIGLGKFVSLIVEVYEFRLFMARYWRGHFDAVW